MHFVVYNPVAGRGRAARALRIVQPYFAEHGMPLRVLTSEHAGHAKELVRALPEDAGIVALGGDGTVHEVAAECVGTRRTLGVVPSGSGDDFAYALGIDRHDTRIALEVIRRGSVRAVDVGIVNDHPFVNAVGVGFDADVAARVTSAPAFLRGVSAYLYAILVSLKDFSSADAHVEVDGRLVHDGPALLVGAQNGPRSGGSFLFAPAAEIDDGLLDVLIAGRFSRAGAIGILPRLIRGAHLDHPEVRSLRGRHVRISWSRSRPYHMEGEVAEPVRELEIALRPGALRVWA